MNPHPRRLLETLLKRGDKLSAGIRSRRASLTVSDLSAYQQSRSLDEKESFESAMKSARAQGAITLIWDNEGEENGFIQRIDLADREILAKVLGEIPLEQILKRAQTELEPFHSEYPVLAEVMERWAKLKKVRSCGPETVQKWVDAVRTIKFTREVQSEHETSFPLRDMSARLFKDSKRIEKLAGPIDVLLSGSVEAEIRDPDSVWQELGLFREEQPVRLAGNIQIERDKISGYLDVPYIGLHAHTIKKLIDVPTMIMTIENQTTFHNEARKRCDQSVLLLYTAGMPSPAWRAMYVRVLRSVPKNVPIYHWGDIDEGGFRIASRLAQDARTCGHDILPWLMHPKDIPEGQKRRASTSTLERIRHFAETAGWSELGTAIVAAGDIAEQEGL